MQNNYTTQCTESCKISLVRPEELWWLQCEKLFQDELDAAVKVLLSLKADYKAATGKDWKPGAAPAAAAAVKTPAGDADQLNQLIGEQGNKVRDLKAKKAPKVSCVVCTSWT